MVMQSFSFGIDVRFVSAGMCVLMGLWAAFLLPETKGVEIEAVFRLFQNHWFWSKIPAVKHMSMVSSLPHTSKGVGASEKPGAAPGNGNLVENQAADPRRGGYA